MVPRRVPKKKNVVKDINYNNLSLGDVLCPICRTILIEPVTLPCNHVFCSSCFDGTMANTNLVCPLCRIRIGSWLRASRKDNKLVNLKLWQAIQAHFPTQVKNKLDGIDENLEEYVSTRVAAEPGEIRREYEVQKAKEEEELRKQREEEVKASEILIQKLKEEEELEKSINEEKLKEDEKIAKKLAEDLSFDPGPSTSKIEIDKNQRKKGPLDTFLRNMADKQLSVSFKEPCNNNCDKLKKKEFTTKVLFQDRSKKLSLVNHKLDNFLSSTLNEIIKKSNSFDSSDTLNSETRYFKPIEQNIETAVKNIQKLHVPAISPSASSKQLRSPTGKIAFNHCSQNSPFVGLKSSLISNSKSKSIVRKRTTSNSNEESQGKPKKARVELNHRKTRSTQKLLNYSSSSSSSSTVLESEHLCTKVNSPSKRVTRNDHKTKEDEQNTINVVGEKLLREFSPFRGFDKNDIFPLKSRNGIKNLILGDVELKIEQITRNQNHRKNGEQKSSAEQQANGYNGYLKRNDVEAMDTETKLFRSDAGKRKQQEEEDLKLAQKLHEELNCFKYPTRNNNRLVHKNFKASRKQITLHKFLEK